MKIIVCKVGYRIYSISKLLAFTATVRNGIYTNPLIFVAPPYTEVDFDIKFDAYSAAANDYKQYGITKKTVFIEKKDELIKALNTTAVYVDDKSAGNVSVIALSGFEATKNQNQPVLNIEKIENFSVKNKGVSGQIYVEIGAIKNRGTVNYSCVCAVGGPLVEATIVDGQFVTTANDPQIRQDCNKSRRKTFNGLTPGIPYYIYVFANNSTGVSPMSDFKILHSI